jgi:hypothetical protein
MSGEHADDGTPAPPTPWWRSRVGAYRLVGYGLVLFLLGEVVWGQVLFGPLGALTPFTALLLPCAFAALEWWSLRRAARHGTPIAAAERAWTRRIVLGEVLVLLSFVVAFALQASYTTPPTVARPELAVWIVNPAGPEPLPRAVVSTEVTSPYLSCATRTVVRLRLPPGMAWRPGHAVGVGTYTS